MYPTILFVLNNHPDGGRIPLKLPSEDMNRGVNVPVGDCIPEVNHVDTQVANAAPQSSQSPADSTSENARSKLKQKLLSKYRSKRKLNVFEPKKTPKHIKKLRTRNRTSFADLEKRFTNPS